MDTSPHLPRRLPFRRSRNSFPALLACGRFARSLCAGFLSAGFLGVGFLGVGFLGAGHFAEAEATPAPWTSAGGLFSEDAGSAGENASDGTEVPDLDELEEKRAAVDEEIEALRGKIRAGQVEASNEDAAELRDLEKIHTLLGRQISEQKRAKSLEDRAAEIEANRKSGLEGFFDHEPPFGFDDLDGLLARLDAIESRAHLLDDTVAAGEEALDEAEQRFDDAEQHRRQIKERWENADGARQVSLANDLEDARREARLSREEALLHQLQLVNDRREGELLAEQHDLLDDAVAWVRENLQPTDEELQNRLDQLAEDQDALREQLAQIRSQVERDQSRLLRALSRLGIEQDGAEPPDDDASAETVVNGSENEIEDPALRARIETLRTELDLADRRSRLIEDRIERRDLQAQLWRMRHRLASGPLDVAERNALAAEAQRLRSELERDQRLLRSRAEDLRAELRQVEDRLISSQLAAEVSRWLRQRQEAYRTQIDWVEEELLDLATALALAQRVEAKATLERLDFSALTAAAWTWVQSMWNWEITRVEDRSITLGKVIMALLLLIVGYKLSKRLSQAFGRVLQQRFGLSSGAAHALQNLGFYVLLVIFFLWALQLVSIPITVFALLGGVAAIGLGFGSQNVVNNFISGLILLVERPIKVGDLVEVDGTLGSVERIGLRSARVRAGDNTHVIVPNSTFLEQKVLNWTVSDDIVRSEVDVGVAYGSPVETVRELMLQALTDEPAVVQNMPQEVMFMNFGDNALLFRAYFWIRVQGFLDTYRTQSKVRFTIDRLFREADIVISFPQRDVHLDTLSPLQVRVLGSEGEPDAKE